MIRTLLLVACAALGSVVAQAQTTVVAPGAAQSCLTRGEPLLGTPDYPQEAYEARARGRVLVELEFTTTNTAPKLLKLEANSEAGGYFADAFERSVRKFVESYRVPCLATGEMSRLDQEFVFVPHDMRGVTMMVSTEPGVGRKDRLRACVRRPDQLPTYPADDLRVGREGKVVTRLSFRSADQPPELAVLDDAGSRNFVASVTEFARGMRMPCHDGAGSVDLLFLFDFRLDVGARVVLKDMPFLTLLRSIKGIRQAQVYFDFRTMGCPFEVHFEPWQPIARNSIGEVGKPDPERRFFLDWLSRQQLNLPPRTLNAVMGQDARVSVPCMVLNLGTTSGGGASQ